MSSQSDVITLFTGVIDGAGDVESEVAINETQSDLLARHTNLMLVAKTGAATGSPTFQVTTVQGSIDGTAWIDIKGSLTTTINSATTTTLDVSSATVGVRFQFVRLVAASETLNGSNKFADGSYIQLHVSAG